jgi:outer membrane protein insertion porin family
MKINHTSLRFSLLFALVALSTPFLSGQISNDTTPTFDYSKPGEFEIGAISVTGAEFSDDNAIISISGLVVGDKVRIPGAKIPRAIKNLWNLRLFTDVRIIKSKNIGDVIFLEIIVVERPRLSTHSFTGIGKSQHESLNEVVNKFLVKGGIITDNIKVNAAEGLEKHFANKGFFDSKVTVTEVKDTARVNSVNLVFDITRGEKIRIEEIVLDGNIEVPDKKLLKKLSKTKERKKLLAASKLVQKEYKEDQKKLIDYYNTIGYRDARILKDSIWRDDEGFLRIKLFLNEGKRYFFRNLTWKGNSIYDDKTLTSVLGIEKGDVYNQELLDNRLKFSQDGRDVSSLYMDFGYLFFQVDPVEVAIIEDSIDIELRIFEGPQANIDKVVIAGNDRTHEHVIRRELRTLPAEKFSRSDIIRSQREITNLNYFNPENMGINTPVNPDRGTVDIEYKVEEKPSDQLELSAGWGGFNRVIGTLGVSFNNFSLRNIFNKEAWKPLPMGDGQRLSLRAQTNGDFYQSYNVSLSEPWLGGRKPNSFTIGGFYNRFAYGQRGTSTYQSLNIKQGSVSFGTRLKWPDDNFVASTALNIQTLTLQNWQGFQTDKGEAVNIGNFNNFSLRQIVSRSSINDPLFPKQGSNISLSVQFTLPYSLFQPNKDYTDLPVAEKFRYLEYNKWRFDAEWYTTLTGKLVLKAAAKIGILGSYNKNIGAPPFERFQLGGDGINNQQFGFQGVDIISMRGYEINQLEANISPGTTTGTAATPIFDKFTIELRYPVSLNPSSTIYVLAFGQGGNSWRSIRDFNPFDMKRSVGFGLRVFLPMFGTLGFDYGLGFDKTNAKGLREYGDFNIILGFEPE